jgi:hypothetical protein
MRSLATRKREKNEDISWLLGYAFRVKSYFGDSLAQRWREEGGSYQKVDGENGT